jgi:hypothetical protein
MERNWKSPNLTKNLGCQKILAMKKKRKNANNRIILIMTVTTKMHIMRAF